MTPEWAVPWRGAQTRYPSDKGSRPALPGREQEVYGRGRDVVKRIHGRGARHQLVPHPAAGRFRPAVSELEILREEESFPNRRCGLEPHAGAVGQRRENLIGATAA